MTGRIMSWVWLALMISFASTLTYGGGGMRPRDWNPIMWMLLITVAYVAAGSFRRERETGALELILVTPLSEKQIINGRLRGLWGQFLPTFLLWVAVMIYISLAVQRWRPGDLIEFTIAYFIVPVVGLYFSLRFRFVVLAWLATLAVCFAAPQLVWWLFDSWLNLNSNDNHSLPHSIFVSVPVQLLLAALLLRRLRVNLARRSFSLR